MTVGISTVNADLHFATDQDSAGTPIVSMQVSTDEKTQQCVILDKDDMKQIIRVLNFLGQEMQ